MAWPSPEALATMSDDVLMRQSLDVFDELDAEGMDALADWLLEVLMRWRPPGPYGEHD